MVEFGWTMFFQVINILLMIGLIYFVFYLVVKLPRRIKDNNERLEKIEKQLEEINKKI
ncbi:hypothetical protein [Alkaliphilus serpentinus]|uniref:hypothetical protein n=1 Tax=Alkaliphilus serpentinus TaxID=1482731 RepID=UPI0018658207|nr:hypothetical protein [Alkaliphilus serpentinus]